jgi:hypothetical protein
VNRHRDARPEPWSLTLPAGDYHFRALIGAHSEAKVKRLLFIARALADPKIGELAVLSGKRKRGSGQRDVGTRSSDLKRGRSR